MLTGSQYQGLGLAPISGRFQPQNACRNSFLLQHSHSRIYFHRALTSLGMMAFFVVKRSARQRRNLVPCIPCCRRQAQQQRQRQRSCMLDNALVQTRGTKRDISRSLILIQNREVKRDREVRKSGKIRIHNRQSDGNYSSSSRSTSWHEKNNNYAISLQQQTIDERM